LGAGSTIAAAAAVGYRSIGVESDATYFDVAVKAIPAFAALSRDGFDDAVRLPQGLTVAHLRGAIDFAEEKNEELTEMHFAPANVFWRRHWHLRASRVRRRMKRWSRRAAPAHGRFSRITIIRDGIWCGDMPSIRPSG